MNLLFGVFFAIFLIEYSEYSGNVGFYLEAVLWGRYVEIKDLNFMAFLRSKEVAYANETRHWLTCSAVIINEKMALTAAHCFHKVNYSTVNLRFGRVKINQADRDGKTFRRNIDQLKIKFHPKLKPVKYGYSARPEYFKHDIAVIHINPPLPFRASIGAIKLPDKNLTLQDRDKLIIAGYGAIVEENLRDTTDVYLTINDQVEFISTKTCGELIYSDFYRIFWSVDIANIICLGPYKKPDIKHYTWNGDSGGLVGYKTPEGELVLVGTISGANWGNPIFVVSILEPEIRNFIDDELQEAGIIPRRSPSISKSPTTPSTPEMSQIYSWIPFN